MAAGLGDLVHLQAVDLALGGEEQHVGVRGSHKQVLHEVGVLQVHALHALAAALLLAVGAHGQALDIAGLGHGDDHVLFGDEVLHLDILGLAGQAGAARGVVFLLDLLQLFLDDLLQQVLVGKDLLVVGDLLAQLGQLFLDLGAFQAGQAAQAHFQDGVGLLLGKTEALGEARGGFLVRLGGADDVDDLVDVIERNDIAFEDVLALLGLGQLVAGATGDNIFLVLDIVEENFLQREHARGAVHQGQHIAAEAHLQLGVLEQLVQHHLRDGVGLQIDDDVDALAVGGVVDVADFGQLLVTHQLAELLQQALTVHLVGNFLHHNGGAAVLLFLDLAFRADGEVAVAGFVGIKNALLAHDEAARGEVGAGHGGEQVLRRAIRVIDHEAGGVDGLAQVVGRDVGGHADGDAVRAVDQQVREARRQHRRLLQRLVVVGLEVDRLLVQVTQKLHSRLVEARLGVTHGSGGVAVDGAEVAVAVDERQAQAEGLGQAHHGVVHGVVAMGMVLADHVADGTGRLHVRLVRRVAGLVHGVQDAAVHRLQTVAHVGQGAGDDNGHGILEEGGLHLLAEKCRAHDGALAAVGALDDGAVGVWHVDHQRAGALFLGDEAGLIAVLVGVFHVFFFIEGGAGAGEFRVVVALIIGVHFLGQVQGVLLGGLYLVAVVVEFVKVISHLALLNIQEADVAGVFLDELLARLHLLAHKLAHHALGLHGIVDVHLQKRAGCRLHGGLPQLLGVHLAEALVALNIKLAGVVVLGQGGGQRLLVVDVALDLRAAGILLLQAEDGRLGDVDVAEVDELGHVAVEERQQQAADVRTVDVGIGHDDDAMVAGLLGVEVLADVSADRGNERADGIGGQRAVQTGTLHIQNLTAQRQDGLELAVAGLFGRTACGIALYNEDFGLGGVLAGAVGELAGHAERIEHVLAAGHLAGLAGSLAGLQRLSGLADDALGRRGVLLQVLAEALSDGVLH